MPLTHETSVVVYDEVHINKWLKAQAEFPQKIADCESVISQLQKEIDALNATLRSLQGEQMVLQRTEETYKFPLPPGMQYFNSIAEMDESRLADINRQIDSLKNRGYALNQKLAVRYGNLLAFRNVLNEAHEHLEAAQQFQAQLKSRSEILYTSLACEVLTAVQGYERQYPANQALKVRYSIHMLLEGMQQLNQAKAEECPHGKYYALCYLLWRSFRDNCMNESSTEFNIVLQSLLQKTHTVDISQITRYCFGFFDVEESFARNEKVKLENLCDEVSTLCTEDNNNLYIQSLAPSAGVVVRNIKTSLQLTPDTTDVKLYTTMMKYARYVLTGDDAHKAELPNPSITSISSAAQECIRLAKLDQCQSNSNKVIAGAFLILAGVALIFASIALACFTCGAFSLFSAFFSVKGAMILTAGVGSLLVGCGLFEGGQRTVVAKSMLNLVNLRFGFQIKNYSIQAV